MIAFRSRCASCLLRWHCKHLVPATLSASLLRSSPPQLWGTPEPGCRCTCGSSDVRHDMMVCHASAHGLAWTSWAIACQRCCLEQQRHPSALSCSIQGWQDGMCSCMFAAPLSHPQSHVNVQKPRGATALPPFIHGSQHFPKLFWRMSREERLSLGCAAAVFTWSIPSSCAVCWSHVREPNHASQNASVVWHHWD